jgi:hypothetical protein
MYVVLHTFVFLCTFLIEILLHQINVNNLDRKRDSVTKRYNLKEIAVVCSDPPTLISSYNAA